MHSRTHQPQARKGSLLAVLGVLVVLFLLGGSTLMLSNAFHRKDRAYSVRESAFEAARAAAEEAALLINNGKVNVSIDEAMGSDSETFEVPLQMFNSQTLSFMGLPTDKLPKVQVRAAVVGPDALPAKLPVAKLEEISEVIESRGYDSAKLSQLQKFWSRVDGTDTVFAGETEKNEGIQDDSLHGRFMNRTQNVKISKWGPSNRVRTETLSDGTTERIVESDNKMPELLAVYRLFYQENADQTSGSRSGAKPSPGQLRPMLDQAMEAVGKESSTRMESCGSNPALAMSHLVGDLEQGKAVSSGTEVAITADFLQSQELGANKTYLLEIQAEMDYSGPGKSGKVARYTTYRLFQKAEWEDAVENMTRSLLRSLMDHGVSPQEIAQMYPPQTGVSGRDEELPGSSGVQIDFKAVVSDPVFKHLPSTVGAKMYPYTVANAYPSRR